jgi:hypothetical protein
LRLLGWGAAACAAAAGGWWYFRRLRARKATGEMPVAEANC